MGILPTVQSFKYIGSTIDRGRGANTDVDNRVAKAWSKWRELSGVICDKKSPTKLKLDHDISDSHQTDFALWMRNMHGQCQSKMKGNNID